QHEQTPPEARRLINGARQIIETVNSQLTEQFGIERNRAHTFLGLCTRLYGKLAAHTLCIYLNRLIAKTHPLQIKPLAFN
ncbi:MAG: IS982 family transposase, partial [Chloroflexota bacterium]|nr:IS982 family transposase [Chloroflexota bacterium]